MFKGKDNPLTLDWSRVRVFDREVGQMFINLTKTSREAQVGSAVMSVYGCPGGQRGLLDPMAVGLIFSYCRWCQ